ncbi:DUF1428 family protein (plasmid) [Agrobacterium sp. MA01]|uniref:DUF1428 domain-containing protein n=1 Tax=Agrobacterium sp. MA01 TaxID=2664893 RepID=UPI00129A92E6|nr:DUF1428 domain-containing protein [Agrobacterium sp. MA01]QGG93282.1 DUF1428 family protein [Agrobacterium sp. MA01]
MTYIDGFLTPVPVAMKKRYLEHARTTALVFRSHGALAVMENWGDDLPDGDATSIRKAVLCREDETVCLAWVVWPDKQTRDAALMKVFTDPKLSRDQNPAPYDGKRLIRGGFQTVVFESAEVG